MGRKCLCGKLFCRALRFFSPPCWPLNSGKCLSVFICMGGKRESETEGLRNKNLVMLKTALLFHSCLQSRRKWHSSCGCLHSHETLAEIPHCLWPTFCHTPDLTVWYTVDIEFQALLALLYGMLLVSYWYVLSRKTVNKHVRQIIWVQQNHHQLS